MLSVFVAGFVEYSTIMTTDKTIKQARSIAKGVLLHLFLRFLFSEGRNPAVLAVYAMFVCLSAFSSMTKGGVA